MDDEPRVIRVDAAQPVSVGDVASAGARTGASHVLVELGGVPVSVVPIADLGKGDPTRVDARATGARQLTREAISVQLPNGERQDLVAYVESDLAVLTRGNARFVVPLRGEDVTGALSFAAPLAFAIDARLPGPTVPTEPQTVFYECELGHPVSQRADDPNRTCWCGRDLEAA
jgi:hypothetical protein